MPLTTRVWSAGKLLLLIAAVVAIWVAPAVRLPSRTYLVGLAGLAAFGLWSGLSCQQAVQEGPKGVKVAAYRLA